MFFFHLGHSNTDMLHKAIFSSMMPLHFLPSIHPSVNSLFLFLSSHISHTYHSVFICVLPIERIFRILTLVFYLDNRQPHVLGCREPMQQQQWRRRAAWRPTTGITETVTSTVRILNHQPQPAANIPEKNETMIRRYFVGVSSSHI